MDIGVNSEFGKLNSVLLHIPTQQELDGLDVKKAMYQYLPKYEAIMREILAYIELLESLDVTVYTDLGFPGRMENGARFPNLIYMKDLAIVTPDKVVMCRPFHKVRQGEEIYTELLLKHIGVQDYQIDYIPIGYHEGADVVWLNPRKILINYGYRTTDAAASSISDYFRKLYGIKSKFIEGNKHHRVPQHIQGSKHIFSLKNAAIREELEDDDLGFENVYRFKETHEIKNRYALNVITINENEIIMPAGCPETKAAYESLGVKCHESPMEEISKGAGGFACMTLFLNRDKVDYGFQS
jgi:arginine deiminase